MSAPKRPKVSDLTEEEKNKHKEQILIALTCFRDCTIAVLQISGKWPVKDKVIDGDRANIAFAIVMTYHKASCQTKNGKGSIAERINTDGASVECYPGIELKWSELKKIFDQIFQKYGLTYVKNDPKPWYSICNPILYSFMAFRVTWKEVHLGTEKYDTDKKQDGTRKQKTISHYGMKREHSVLCDGITLPPYMKGPLLSSLGPGALLAYFLDNEAATQQIYKDKMRTMILDLFAAVPRIDEIVEVLTRMRIEEVRGIVSKLCTYLMMGGYKTKHRATFPPYILLQRSRDREVLVKIKDTTRMDEDGVETEIFSLRSNFTTNILSGFEKFDLTGAGMWQTYHAIEPVGLRISQYGDEALTHAILHTHLEDFGILKFATNRDFHRREEFRDAFSNRDSQEVVEVKPVRFNYVSKMSTANVAPQLSVKKKQVISVPVLGGKRKRLITEDFKAFVSSQASKPGHFAVSSNRNLELELEDDLEDALKTLAKNPNVGTVQWYEANALGTYDVKSTTQKPKDVVPEETGVYFR